MLILFLSAGPALADSGLTGDRSISPTTVSPGDTFQVSVTISSDRTETAPAIDEDLPDGWIVTEVDYCFATYRENGNEWIWPREFSPNVPEMTIIYNVTVPSTQQRGLYNIKGNVSAYGTGMIPITGDGQVTIAIYPVVGFTANQTSGYKGQTIQFTDTSSDADSLYWDFGDGTNSTQTDPTHQFNEPGSYTVTLSATNPDGTDSKTMNIEIYDVDFTADVTEGEIPLSVTFTDLSENAVSWSWDVNGDGMEDYDTETVNHIYSIDGIYTVSLTVSDGTYSGTQTKVDCITAAIYPVASFTANQTSGYKGQTIQFTDTSANADSLYWDFGDDTNSTQVNPIHQFSEPGSYTVTLNASNVYGTNIKTMNIEIYDVDFTANVTEGEIPLNVSFTDLSENAVSWSWDVDGDGMEDYNTETANHTYETPGEYTVSLTVSDGTYIGTETKVEYITVLNNNDWNPWNDPGSANGEYITIGELIAAYNCYSESTPAPQTGETITIGKLIAVYNAYNNKTPM